MVVSPEIEPTEDGSQTLRHPLLGECYHSTRGARGESEHVFIANGFDLCHNSVVRVLEVGFGSGLNCWLTLLKAAEGGRTVVYTAVELYPVAMATVHEICYGVDANFVALHNAPWNEWVEVTMGFELHKIEGDLLRVDLGANFDLVYFDAFAPDCQPELWSVEVFQKIFDAMATGGALVTYCSKGDVKRALRQVGFEVSRLPGALGKRHMVRALKPNLQV